ncbi:MAG: DUF1080 domain-containing protein [Verrucomicrobiota bacterium]
MKSIATLLLITLLTTGSLLAEEWIPLFNGKDLTGWTAEGAVDVQVSDGVIVGKQKTVKGGNLIHETDYDNFELRFSYKVDWPANSGVWFRFNGKKGYQFDILKHPKPVAFSGALYCPGKLFITNNLDESLEKRDDWNEGRILANGEELKLWLNGTLVGEAKDSTHSKGKIAIQIHGGKQFTEMGIHIRSIEIREIDSDTAS